MFVSFASNIYWPFKKKNHHNANSNFINHMFILTSDHKHMQFIDKGMEMHFIEINRSRMTFNKCIIKIPVTMLFILIDASFDYIFSP